MKSKLSYFVLTLGLALTACNGIPEDDRFIEVEPATVARTVLLEDFTGQNCTNCPAAHRKIDELEEQYGSSLIAVSIHAGMFGIPATNTRYTGLMQQEGNDYCDRYHIDEFPMGVVNGKLPVLGEDLWASAVYDEISKPTPVSIAIDAELDGSFINIACSVGSSVELNGHLVVWLIESGIVARQEDADLGRINDYVHNNVFRACVNGLNGTPIRLDIDDSITEHFSIPVKDTATEKWVPANLAIVAFVNDGTGVAQAASSTVKIEE